MIVVGDPSMILYLIARNRACRDARRKTYPPKEPSMFPHYIRTSRRPAAGTDSPALASIEGYSEKLNGLLYSEGQRVYKYVGEAKRIDTPGEKIKPKVGYSVRTTAGRHVHVMSVATRWAGVPAIAGIYALGNGVEEVGYFACDDGKRLCADPCIGDLIFNETKPSTRTALIGPDGNEVAE